MRKARAIWHNSDQTTQVLETSLSPSEADNELWCMVRAHYSLISTGTERLVALGQVPGALYESMRVPYMEGSFAFPVKYGYSLVGTVEEGPEAWLGKKVHLMHPHQDYCRVRVNDLSQLPDQLPLLRATLASNLETALNAVWDSGVSIGDRVLVVGFGIIGSLLARLLKSMKGVQLWIAETEASRLALAQEMGFATTEDKADVDVAFHTSGSSSGLQQCINQVGQEGKVIELSWYGQQAVELHLGGSFHQQRKQLISSQVASLPAARRARWDYRRRKAVVMELLKDPAFDQHLGSTIPLEQASSLFADIRQHSSTTLSWVIAY